MGKNEPTMDTEGARLHPEQTIQTAVVLIISNGFMVTFLGS
jgi:hypothetical protein